MADLYRLSEEEWGRIDPYLPKRRRDAHRVDDRRGSPASCTCWGRVRTGTTARPNTALTQRSTVASTGGAGKGFGRMCSMRLPAPAA